jgi:predicted DNA-binding transcriptional regulator YafY
MEVDMSRALNRTERLRKIEKLYLYGAFTDEEMAERVGVDSRTTIYKDRQLLTEEGVPFEEVERGRWRIDRKKYLSNLRVNVHQAAQLYLMARRLARQTRRPNPHVVSVLKSLALILHQPLMDRLHQSADFIPQAADESEQTAVLEKLVACWVEQRKVRFRYRGLHARQPTVHLVSPYLLEPSLLGEGIYLVGYSETMNKIVPFKIDRIEKAADTSQPIIPPESFDETEFIRNVWSIWDGEGELVTVKLRFRGETAVRRVQETIWHPNQAEPELLPNGDLIWTAQVAEWREMLPWIRGWGAQVEVLEPSTLRRELEREVLKLADIYQITTQTISAQEDDDDYDDQWAAALFRVRS